MNALNDTNDTALLSRLGLASRATAEDYLEAARLTLEALAARPGLLDGLALKRTPGGYARNLVYGDDDISVWAMVWSVGARTSIHDHHCSCCFAVLKGTVGESRFEAIDAKRAVLKSTTARGPGYVACMLPTGPNLHQMTNLGDEEAISLHIYGFDHRLHASSIDREYELAAL
ncbi:cysteine dioxygenase [Xanthobacter pseudotagetidis]|uniref:cysteine dioxygenase n=1 Tax=Xanthobacter pseudotagetidis TaxID=3119911 RepID=UPI00372A4B58